MQPFQAGKPHWWQWPTVLSLDAPAVAVAWQWLVARSAGDTLAWHHHVVLGVSVWLAYSADRWIEGWRLPADQMQTQRHLFYLQHRWTTFVGWVTMLVAAVGLAVHTLSLRELQSGLLVLLPVLLYLLSHQLVHRHHPLRVPKEMCVALLFAAGVVCFTLARIPNAWSQVAAPLGLFGLLCFTDCALISLWEHEVDRHHGQTSLALQYPGSRRLVRLLPWIIAAIALGFAVTESGPLRIATLCAAASGVLLGLVDRRHPRHGRQLSRVLADVVLLTPLVPWGLAALLGS